MCQKNRHFYSISKIDATLGLFVRLYNGNKKIRIPKTKEKQEP
jgi:hypothetical protein